MTRIKENKFERKLMSSKIYKFTLSLFYLDIHEEFWVSFNRFIAFFDKFYNPTMLVLHGLKRSQTYWLKIQYFFQPLLKFYNYNYIPSSSTLHTSPPYLTHINIFKNIFHNLCNSKKNGNHIHVYVMHVYDIFICTTYSRRNKI